MDYDEIDQYVDQLFRAEKPQGSQEIQPTGSGDWRIGRIDEIIEDEYNNALWWHNNRIAGDACKSCGISHTGGCMAKPTDGEILDANSYGQLAGETRPTQYGKRGPAVYVNDPQAHRAQTGGGGRKRGGGCIIAMVLGVLAIVVIWALTVI